MLTCTRWFFSNIAGSIVGVGLGIFVAWGVYALLSALFSIESCSGMPCGEYLGVVVIISGIAGGIVGGIIGYGTTQRLLHRTVETHSLFRYGLIGALLWPLVGTFSLVSFFVYIFTVHSWFDFLGRTSLYFDIYTYIMLFVLFVTLPGMVLGVAFALLRRDKIRLHHLSET